MEIYERTYDNNLNNDGSTKPNKLLGTFKILEIIEEDAYDSIKTAHRVDDNSNDLYLIVEREVKHWNAGSRTTIHKLNIT